MTTWEKAIKCCESAVHGPAGESTSLDGINADINSIIVTKEHDGNYSIHLEVIFISGEDITAEQVVKFLKELSALDEEWE